MKKAIVSSGIFLACAQSILLALVTLSEALGLPWIRLSVMGDHLQVPAAETAMQVYRGTWAAHHRPGGLLQRGLGDDPGLGHPADPDPPVSQEAPEAASTPSSGGASGPTSCWRRCSWA